MMQDVQQAKKRKSVWLGWVRLGVSLATIGIVLAVVDLKSVLSALGQVGLSLWCAILFVYLLGHVVSAYKWRILAAPQADMVTTLRAHFSGLAANIALPGAASGDIVRAGVMAASAPDRARLAVGSLADRLIDTAGLGILATLGFAARGDGLTATHLLALAAATVLIPTGVVLARPLLSFLVARVSGAGKVQSLIRKLLEAGLVLSKSSMHLFICLVLSMGVQSAFIAASAALGRAAGVKASLANWFFAWPISKLVATIPTSAGGLGVREASLAGLMTQFGADPARVFASGLVWQSIVIIGALAGGLIIFLLTLKKPKISATPAATSRTEKD
jgi:glycosyltransferase 2 family protein